MSIDNVLELFDIFIIPTFTYSLSLWTSKCATSVLDSIDATYSKFLKRYLQVPAHSSNKIVHFLTSTIPLSKRLRQLAPHNIGALSFPPEMNGHRLTFLKGDNSAEEAENIYESIPSTFWLSRNLHTIPTSQKLRRRLCREVLDSEHHLICKSTTFHPTPTDSCICLYCSNHAHMFHHRFCEAFN